MSAAGTTGQTGYWCFSPADGSRSFDMVIVSVPAANGDISPAVTAGQQAVGGIMLRPAQ